MNRLRTGSRRFPKARVALLLLSVFALLVFSVFRYSWKARVRADLLMKGHLIVELDTHPQSDELNRRGISQLAVCLVYARGEYLGYITKNLRLILPSQLSPSPILPVELEKRAQLEVALLLGQVASAILLLSVIFMVVLRPQRPVDPGSNLQATNSATTNR